MSNRGRKSKLNPDAVLKFAVSNPSMRQCEIAAHFGVSQSRVSHILREGGVLALHPGRPIKQRPEQTSEQYEWEKLLHEVGLGMDRGLRLHGKRILYGYDTAKEAPSDNSATIDPSF